MWKTCEGVFLVLADNNLQKLLNKTSYKSVRLIIKVNTLLYKKMSDKIFVGHNSSSDKIFVTSEKFRHFCPTSFCPIRYHSKSNSHGWHNKYPVGTRPKLNVQKTIIWRISHHTHVQLSLYSYWMVNNLAYFLRISDCHHHQVYIRTRYKCKCSCRMFQNMNFLLHIALTLFCYACNLLKGKRVKIVFLDNFYVALLSTL